MPTFGGVSHIEARVGTLKRRARNKCWFKLIGWNRGSNTRTISGREQDRTVALCLWIFGVSM